MILIYASNRVTSSYKSFWVVLGRVEKGFGLVLLLVELLLLLVHELGHCDAVAGARLTAAQCLGPV